MTRQTPTSALSGASTVCRFHTLFQTVSGRMRREHRQTQLKSVNIENEWLTDSEAGREARVSRATPYRYWSIGVGPRHYQQSARWLVRRAWLTDWLLAQEAHLMGITVDDRVWDLRKRTRKGRATRFEVRRKVADLELTPTQVDAIRWLERASLPITAAEDAFTSAACSRSRSAVNTPRPTPLPGSSSTNTRRPAKRP